MIKNKNKTTKVGNSFIKALNNFIATAVHNTSLVIFIAVACIILLSDLNHLNIIEKVKNKSMSLLLMPMNFFDQVLDKPVNSIKLAKDLFTIYKDNKRLSEENEKLKHYYIQYKFLQYEYEELKKLLAVGNELKTRVLTAKLVGLNQSIYNHNATILLDDKRLLNKGQLVINEQGVIGKVREFGDNYARVQLVTDPTSRIPVTLISSKLKAIVAGNSSNCLDLLHMTDEGQIRPGELVITASDGELVAAGQLVGRIEQRDNKYCVRMSVDLTKVEYVTVIDYSL